mgnify:CR=1 FL=1
MADIKSADDAAVLVQEHRQVDPVLLELEQERDLQNYVRRAILEPTPGNLELFKSLFREQKRLVQRFAAMGAPQMPIGEDWLAIVSTFLNFGGIVFRPQIEAALGHDLLARGVSPSFNTVQIEIFRHVFNLDAIKSGGHEAESVSS